MSIGSRRLLAALRLGFYYVVLCGLLLAAGLQLRADREAGAGDVRPASFGVSGASTPFLGVTVELEADTLAARRAMLADLRANGFGWARQRFDWAQIEPQPDEFDWRFADAAISALVDAGLEPVVVLDGSPPWARAAQDIPPDDNPLAPPADPATFARFAAAFAARYGDRVTYYQLWDEPNIAPHWGNRLVEPVAYAQLLKAAGPAIRGADPGALILTAALAPTADRGHTAMDEGYFLQRMLAAGAGPYFDAVAIQPFGFGHAADYPRQERTVLDFQRTAWIRRVLVDAGLGHMPIWAVRFGWNRAVNPMWGTVTPEAQAREATAALDLAWNEWPWLSAMGWVVARPGAPPGDPRWGFALWDAAGAPAPVLEAIAAWATATEAVPRPPAGALARNVSFVPWLVLAGALVLVGWRSYAAARLLPWRNWLAAFRRSPWAWQAAAWGSLLSVYYFAVWPPLVGLCWAVWALLCLAQPMAGLGLAAALLPFYFQHKELALVDGTLIVPPAVAATLCLTPALIRRAWRRPVPLVRTDWAVAGLLAVTLLAAAGVWQWAAFGQGTVELVFVPVLLWFAVRYFAQETDQRRWLALALFGGGLLVAIWGLGGWLQGAGVQVDGVRRLVGPHFSPNHSALYLVRTVFVGLGLVLAFSSRMRWALLAAVVLVLGALLLTGSRGALLLGLPAGAAAFAWLVLRRRADLLQMPAVRRAAIWLLAGGSLLLVAVGAWLWDRLRNLQTMSLRLDLWEAALLLWRDFLWTGVGPGGFFWRYPAYLVSGAALEPNQLHPHNIWLELGVTWGIAGLLWLGILLYTLWDPDDRAAQMPAPAYWLRAGALAALIAAVAHAQVDAFFLLADLAGWNAIALAMIQRKYPITKTRRR